MRSNFKIQLIHMPQWNISQFPMGIAYIGAYLKQARYQVQTRDLSIEMYHLLKEDKKDLMHDGGQQYLWTDKEKFDEHIYDVVQPFIDMWLLQILKESPDIIGFSALTSNIHPTLLLINRIKKLKPNMKIIIGGPLVTRYDSGFDVIKEKNVDYVITDEGEESALELIDHLLLGEKELKNIKGVMFKNSAGEVQDNGTRELISKIGELPFPDYSLFNQEYYKDLCIPLLGSRGCIFACTFCSETVFWKRFRYRPAENIVAEMEYHLKYMKTNYFYIVDSLINGNIKELDKMCDIIIEKKINVLWGGKASIRTQMTSELLTKMKKAGCVNIEYGIESGSAKVVRDMRKGFTIPIAKRVLKETFEAGIKVGTFFMVGFPTETNEHYEETKNFIIDIKKYLNHITPGFGCAIHKGSDLYENMEKWGIKFDQNGDWYTEAVNNKVLLERVEDFRAFCKDQDLKIG